MLLEEHEKLESILINKRNIETVFLSANQKKVRKELI